MNFLIKPLPMLTNAFGWTVPLGTAIAVSLTLALPTLSQTTDAPSSAPMPAQPGPMRRLNFLNLTSEQQAQIEQIHQNQRSQIDAILTEEQRTQLQQDFQNRGPRPSEENQGSPRRGEGRGMRRSPFESLNLTAEQRSQIEAVMRSSREQMDAVLTDEQRQQLQQHQQQRGPAGT